MKKWLILFFVSILAFFGASPTHAYDFTNIIPSTGTISGSSPQDFSAVTSYSSYDNASFGPIYTGNTFPVANWHGFSENCGAGVGGGGVTSSVLSYELPSSLSSSNCGTQTADWVLYLNRYVGGTFFVYEYYKFHNTGTWANPVWVVLPITLGSPLSGTPTISGGYHFGDDWEVSGTKCPADPGGIWKKHTGSDFVASVSDDVFAAEAGVVKHVEEHSPWAYHIVIEHTHPDGWKYTTVYWHVDPLVDPNDTVTKGEHIADVADIDGDHLHFGVRIGDYTENPSSVGALPVGNCGTWTAFPGGFISPEDSNYIQFE